jgi:glutathione S-transferase
MFPDGQVIAESGAIARYAAKLAGVFPSDFRKAAEADMIYELANDMNLINPVLNWFPAGSDQWQRAHDSFFGSFPHWMEAASNILGENIFFGGDAPHYGDFNFFHICDASITVKPDALELYPRIALWMARIRSIESVAHYLKSRPNCDTPNWGKEGSFFLENQITY